jgi:SAM-dependent methyltransferase
MSDWSEGYTSDINYTFGYYAELNPLRARLALLNAGFACPQTATACELGFGQGISVVMHAAGSATHWHGTDFNPAQAGFAASLAAASKARATLRDDAFADFCVRPDLPEFDFIGLHGIWSWISDENRAVIVDFVRRKLKVGGVLYISYNALPGWTTFAPIRHIMAAHADALGAAGQGSVNKVDEAVNFAEQLLAAAPQYLEAHPAIQVKLAALKTANRQYLAHEYFNRDWCPMHFTTVAQWLAPAKLQFACSANLLDHVDSVNYTPDQQAFLQGIPDVALRENVRDFVLNRQFRRDYWVKGARKINSVERDDIARAQRVVMTAHRPDVSYKARAGLGEVDLSESFYGPVLDLLSDHKERSLAEIEQATAAHGLSWTQLMEIVTVLTGVGAIAPANDEATVKAATAVAAKLNNYLMLNARGSGDVAYLTSPVTGGGVSLTRFEILFLLALKNGQTEPSDLALFVWDILRGQNQILLKDGAPIEGAEANIAELTKQASEFAEKRLPNLNGLKLSVADLAQVAGKFAWRLPPSRIVRP